MKKILKIISAFLVAIFTITTSFAYDLAEKDENLIDRIDDKIIEIIDSGKIGEQKLVDLLKKYNSKKVKSERLQAILEVVIDDIEYEYFLGEYADDVELEEDFVSDDFSGNEDVSEDVDFEAVYSIDGNEVFLEEGKDSEKNNKIFEMFTKLIPVKNRKNIVGYKVYNKPEGGTFAYVEQEDIENDPSKWNLVVNLGAFYKNGKLDFKESVHTLIHEFSHTLTLGQAQIDYSNLDNCNNYLLAEGCLNKNSYLNNFIAKFWADNFLESQKEKDNDFYLNHESDFVTDYAATNPGEDIAESFTYFVLKDKPKNSDTIAKQKILFFYDFKELVKLRNEIRKGINKFKKAK